MTTVKQAYQQLRTQLLPIYGRREATAITAIVVEHITGLNNTGRLVHQQKLLTEEQAITFDSLTNELLQQKPLQYILHEAPFYGMNLYVDENVLIPRPETEELVDWIINSQQPAANGEQVILDIGTGSGCIPIALKKHLPAADVSAIDVSANVLAVAEKNAATQKTGIHFYMLDILNKEDWQQLNHFDIIVSNPPYIARQEAADMHPNVLQYEPQLALFVPNENPLLFYEAIARFGLQHINPGGLLFFEINETYSNEITAMLKLKGYTAAELKKDMQGKNRMIKATLLG